MDPKTKEIQRRWRGYRGRVRWEQLGSIRGGFKVSETTTSESMVWDLGLGGSRFRVGASIDGVIKPCM